jgi:hypothetical protein
MPRFLGVIGVLTCLLLPATGFAQEGATLAGVVKDTSGAVLPGVTVEASSPALIERVRSTVTDGAGQYRLVGLRPGTYSVSATLTGFNTFKRDNIEVSGTGVVTINVDLRVGAIEETVTVSGETPVVDLQSTTKERVMSKEVIDALPSGRMYYTLGVLVPGVNSSSRDVGGALGDTMGSLTAHGGQTGDQRIMQNGLNVMTLQTGGGNIGGSVPNTAAAQEVAIDTSAATAERSTGGVSVNFIPRDGGNTVRGSIFFTSAYEGQQASNFTQDLRDQGLARVNRFKQNWDFNPGVGGPILRDRLWYYYTYRNNGAQNYAAGMFYNQNEFPTFASPLGNNAESWTYRAADGTNGASERQALSQHGDWWDSQIRLTWQMDPKNKFAGTWDQQFYCRCPNGVSATTAPEAANDRRFPVQQLIHGEWWSPLTSKILLEVVALHRTERWGNMDLRPTDQGGSLQVTPAQYALYPSMIGVTQTAGSIQPNLNFHGPAGTFNNNWVPNYTYRWAVSYITGAHAFKVGGEDAFGYTSSTVRLPTLDTLNRPVRYRFSTTNTPDQVTVYNTPYSWKQDVDHNIGLFVQDRWTIDRMTVNAGVRYDYFKSSIPELGLLPSTIGRPAATFAAIDNAQNWKDVTPRLGVAYDLQGDGKTAVKVSLNKYVAGQGGGSLTGGANPITRLTNNNSRNWSDLDGDKVVDCNLAIAAGGAAGAGAECTNTGSSTLLSTAIPGATAENPDGLFDRNVREGWGKRSYNWEFSAGVQREVMPRVSVDVSYFRRWYGNFTATDNQAISPLTGQPIGPADYRSFSIVTPTDSRLPGGGGQTIDGFVDFTSTGAATATAVNRVVFTDDIGAKQVSNWHGVDVSLNARLQNGLLLQGGTSTGRQYTNTCEVSALLPETLGNNPQSFCEQTEPMRTQFKLVSAYTLPRYAALPTTLALMLENIQIAGTFQSLPGIELNATYAMPNSELRNAAFSTLAGAAGQLAACGATNNTAPFGGLCNGAATSTKTVAIMAPVTTYDKRMNQLDIRFGRILRFGRTRTTLNLDVFNAFNDNTILTRNTAFTKTPSYNAATGIGINNSVNSLWVPTSILQARFYKLTATFDF